MALIEHKLDLTGMSTNALYKSLGLGRFILEAMDDSIDPRWPDARLELRRQSLLIEQELARRPVSQVIGLQSVRLSGVVNR